jgi:glucose-fructose oxidoreductase
MEGGFGFRLGSRAWRVDKKLAGGGPLPDVGTYVIQEACRARLEEAPVAVTAREGPKDRPDLFNEVEEEISWTMEFAGGAACEGTASYGRNVNRFRAEAPRGWVEIKPAFSYRGIAGTTSRGPMRFPSVNQQARQMDDFADCILTGRQTPVPGEMGRRDIAIIAAIYEAAATGKRVEIKLEPASGAGQAGANGRPDALGSAVVAGDGAGLLAWTGRRFAPVSRPRWIEN